MTMTAFRIDVTITDLSSGMSASGSIDAEIVAPPPPPPQPPVIDSLSLVPQSAQAGTLRALTIQAHSPSGNPLAYQVVGGTPVAGQPNVFTIVL